MVRSILVTLFLVSASVVIGDDSDSGESSCQPRYWTSGPDLPCNDSVLNISDSSLYNCSEVNLFWSYPMHNLTLRIEAESYSTSRKPFAIRLKNSWMLPVCRLHPTGEEVVEHADEKDQI